MVPVIRTQPDATVGVAFDPDSDVENKYSVENGQALRSQ